VRRHFQVKWVSLQFSDVKFPQDSVYQKLFQPVLFSHSHWKYKSGTFLRHSGYTYDSNCPNLFTLTFTNLSERFSAADYSHSLKFGKNLQQENCTGNFLSNCTGNFLSTHKLTIITGFVSGIFDGYRSVAKSVFCMHAEESGLLRVPDWRLSVGVI